MRIVRLAACSFVLSTLALASDGTLPRSASSDLKGAIEKADAALVTGDRHLALALYEGSLYPTDVKLAFDRDSVETNRQISAVTSALDVWREELDGDFPFSLVNDVKDADVVVRFVDSIPERGEDTLGLIKIEKNYRWSRSFHSFTCKGAILIVRSCDGEWLSQSETRDVVMHEIGHLLGLADSPDVGLLMGPLERGKPLLRPTPGETEDVKALRRTLRGRLRAAAEPVR